jgi:DNA replication protein DnaD
MSNDNYGYISLHRKVMKNFLFREKRVFSRFEAWIYILMNANHTDSKILLGNQLIEVKKGSFITSEIKLMDEFSWSKSKVRSFLILLESQSMIKKNTDTKKTTLTIVKYSDYQDLQTTKKPRKDHKRTAEELQKDTNNNDNNYNNDNNEELNNNTSILLFNNRKNKFKESIKPFVLKFGKDMCNDFFAYWTEPNKSKTKMKFEMQKTWDVNLRLSKWNSNNFNQINKNNATGNKNTEFKSFEQRSEEFTRKVLYGDGEQNTSNPFGNSWKDFNCEIVE